MIYSQELQNRSEKNIIPRIIHYCWFGKGLIPASHKECIQSWKHYLPGWKIKCWNEDNFNINDSPYAKAAYQNKQYAFVADIARLQALHTEGGVYLDTDVELFQTLDPFLEWDFFSGIEIYKDDFEREGKLYVDTDGKPLDKSLNTQVPWLGFLSAVIGAQAGNALIKDCLDYYGSLPIYSNNKFNSVIIDGVLASQAVKYGFRYLDQKQILKENMVVFQSNVLSYDGGIRNKDSALYHHAAQSWQPKMQREKIMIQLDKLHLLKAYKRCAGIKNKLIHFFHLHF